MATVLVNGIDSPLGARVARLLSADPDTRVIGLGRDTPPGPVGAAEWLVARLAGQQLAELLRAEQVTTVVHLAFAGADRPAPSREAAVQQNVLGSMELLGACDAAGVRRVVLRSHSLVYGASPLNPTFLCEDRPPARGLGGLLRDHAEVEQFVAEFAPCHPELSVATLRCAPIVGAWSPLTAYLDEPMPRMLAGFNPSLQLLHVDDAAAAFAAAAGTGLSGAFNLAADDTLSLAQLIRLAGRQPVALLEPLVNLGLAVGNRAMLGAWPFGLSFLRHSCISDCGRARAELGWAPATTAADAVAARTAQAPEDRAANEAALQAFLTRRTP